MVGDAILAFRHLHLLRRVGDAGLRPFWGCELDRVVVDAISSNNFGCGRVPRGSLRTADSRSELRVEVLDPVFGTRRCNPLDAPPDGAIVVRPSKLNVGRLSVLVVGRSITITCACAFAVLVTPHKLLHGLTVEGDRPLSRADSSVLKACARPPGSLDVGLVGVSCGDLGHLAGQRRLIGGALTDNRAVIERERERCSPPERRTTLRRHGRDRELLANSQSLDRPGACNVDLRRGLTRRGRGLRDLSLNLRRVVGAICGAVGQRHGCDGEGGSCCPNLVFHRSVSFLLFRIEGK